ncbi:MAG: TRAP transporter large permease [Bacillota bacterium]
MILLLLGIFCLLLVMGVPVGFTLGIGTLLFIFMNPTFDVTLLTQRTFVGLNNFPLMALPLFILAGNLMNLGGITDRLWKFARAILGFVPGGAGHVSVLSSMLFAAMSGSALATAGGLGPVQVKGMVEDGFPRDRAAAIVAAASTIGPVIPPSIPFVLFGVVGGVSVGKLFMAGVLPGILMGVVLMAYVLISSFYSDYKKYPVPSLKEVASATIQGIPALMTPVVILGGILAGIFTPTEAAAVACAYALGLGIYYGGITWSNFMQTLRNTARTSASIMLIIGTAAAFSWILTSLRVSQLLTDFVVGSGMSVAITLLLLNLVLLVVGCFIETNSAIILLTPILVPVFSALGVDPIQLGVLVCVNLLIGLLTPPMGMSLYVASSVTGAPFSKIATAALPMLIALLVVQLLVTFVPAVSLYLPSVLVVK